MNIINKLIVGFLSGSVVSIRLGDEAGFVTFAEAEARGKF